MEGEAIGKASVNGLYVHREWNTSSISNICSCTNELVLQYQTVNTNFNSILYMVKEQTLQRAFELTAGPCWRKVVQNRILQLELQEALATLELRYIILNKYYNWEL